MSENDGGKPVSQTSEFAHFLCPGFFNRCRILRGVTAQDRTFFSVRAEFLESGRVLYVTTHTRCILPGTCNATSALFLTFS